jgi:hypothetical protein
MNCAWSISNTSTHALKMAFNGANQRLEKVNNRHSPANYWHSFDVGILLPEYPVRCSIFL